MDQPNLCRQHYCSLSRKEGNFSEGTISNACEHVNHPIERETTSDYSTRKPRLKLSAGLQTPLRTWEFHKTTRKPSPWSRSFELAQQRYAAWQRMATIRQSTRVGQTLDRAWLVNQNCRFARNKRRSDHLPAIPQVRTANNLCPCTAYRIRTGSAGSLCLNSWRLSYLSEQKSLRHWNNAAIACCSDSGFPRFCHGVFDSGNAMYKTRTGQAMLCPCVARKRSHSLKPFRNSNPVPKSYPWIQEATES